MNRPNRPVVGSTEPVAEMQEVSESAVSEVITTAPGNPGLSKSRLNTILIASIGGVVVILLAVLIYLLASGTISDQVQSLEGEVARLEVQVEQMERDHADEVELLEQAVADSTVREVVPTTSLQRVEASESPYLWKLDGDFVAPNALDLVGTEMSANSSYIQIGTRFVLRPSDRWYLSSKGAICEFWHPNNIWGKVEALTYKGDNVNEEGFKTTLQSFFLGYPATEITYRRVYQEDRVVGMFAVAEVPIHTPAPEVVTEFEAAVEGTGVVPETVLQTADKGNYVLTVGLVQRGEYAVSTIFIHEANELATTSQELIRTLFSSGSFGPTGVYLRIE